MRTFANMTFAQKVYDAVRRIPKGRVATYGQIAEIIGCPGGSRAVGNALHVNPFAPIVPCHRVVAADGSLASNFAFGGPAGQYERLTAEGITFRNCNPPRTFETPSLLREMPEALAPFSQKPSSASGDARSTGEISDKSTSENTGEILFRKGSSQTFPKVDLAKCGIVIERHPLEPFLPKNGRILFLGSFPPPKARWSMEFFYPNWINDFWRIQGLIHFGDAHRFEAKGEKRFDHSAIIDFCRREGLAFFDTASKVCRWKGNASDEFLEILEAADIPGMLAQMPDCKAIVTTGGKAAEELLSILQQIDGRNAGALSEPGIRGIGATATASIIPSVNDTVTCAGVPSAVPTVGSYVDITIPYNNASHVSERTIRWWRMPSTSRAYPLPLQAKSEHYAKLF